MALTGFDAFREAVSRAQVESGGELQYSESSDIVAGGKVVKILHVQHVRGNEYLRLATLQTALNENGKVTVFEL